MKFVLIAVALLDDLRCGSKVGDAPRSGIGASGVGAVKETEICNLREFAMSLLGTVVSGRRFSFSGQSLCRARCPPSGVIAGCHVLQCIVGKNLVNDFLTRLAD